MNTEQKAKAYDEALNWMRELYPGLHGATKEDAEHYFPELRESEDERVRKWLLECVENLSEGNFIEVSKQDVLFYLEKQKEPTPAEWSEEDELMRTVVIQTLERFGGQGTTGMQIDWLKSLRPQPHWKPSKEQIATLEKWLKDKQFDGASRYVYPIFEPLYEQLKKLM